MPIVTAWIKTEQAQNYIIDPHLKEGFNNVLYTSSGITPMYDSDTPFQISAIDSSHSEVPLTCE